MDSVSGYIVDSKLLRSWTVELSGIVTYSVLIEINRTAVHSSLETNKQKKIH